MTFAGRDFVQRGWGKGSTEQGSSEKFRSVLCGEARDSKSHNRSYSKQPQSCLELQNTGQTQGPEQDGNPLLEVCRAKTPWHTLSCVDVKIH